MSQPKPIMAYQRSNRGEQEWRVGSIDRNQMDMLIQIRGSPGQLRELFQGSPGGHYGTTRSIRGNDRSICEPDYSSNSGVQLRELEIESRDAKIRKAHQKQCCGGCCIIFSPLLKLVLCLSGVLSCCF
ncbi:uncharacterized protein LOC112166686 isoform X1 [Rosa chinensis]|uniref:uncharacterized protein LOC112166686 isoform X1 n=1 Tax=Rosa chinensis TaxID=74649 RepID=UPI000D08EAA8|nr:uncharacterized protein LOC112166686 isoform X1 [Rosa chinensis]